MSERRAFATDGVVRIVGPATVTGVQFYGLLPVVDFTATSITAPNAYTWNDATDEFDAGALASVDLTAWVPYPVFVTGITVPSGGEVYGLLAVPNS